MKGIRERAQEALDICASPSRDGAERLTNDLGPNLAAFVLRVTGPEMRERVRLAVAENIDEGIVQHDITDSIMALLTEGTS